MCSVSEFKALCEKVEKHETQMDLMEKSFPPLLRTVRQLENAVSSNTEKMHRLESTISIHSETIKRNSEVLENAMDLLMKIAEAISVKNSSIKSNSNISIINTTIQNEITNNVSLNGDQAGSARKKSYSNAEKKQMDATEVQYTKNPSNRSELISKVHKHIICI